MGKEIQSEAQLVASLLRQIERSVYRWLMSRVSDQGLTVPQSYVLWYCLNRPGLSLGELSQLMDVANSTISGVVDRLERAGLVERRINPADRRSVQLFATEKGRAVKKDVLLLARDYFAEKLGSLRPDEASQIVAALQKLAAATEEVEVEQSKP